MSIDRQLLYLLRLTVLARLHRAPFDQASRDSIVNMMEQVTNRGVAEWTYQSYCVTVKWEIVGLVIFIIVPMVFGFGHFSYGLFTTSLWEARS